MADQGEMDAALAEQEREALRKVDAYMSKFARLQGLEQMDEETLIGAVEAFHRDASTEFELTGDAYVTEKMGF